MSETMLPADRPAASEVTVSETAPPGAGRLESLDAFRGATIAGMLLVNNPGTWSAIYPPLRHAAWHGWTPTDLIFPYFLFIVGVAMTFSFRKLRERGAGRGSLVRKVARRSLVLFTLGLVLHSFPWIGTDWSELRIPGVLQRIALAYFGASLIVLWTGWRGRLVALGGLLLGYWALLSWVPLPGGAGVLEPGRDLGAFIDRAVFGTEHLWSQTRTWDPEGLLGTLPAIGTVLLGVFTGEWLRGGRSGRRIAAELLLAGAGAVAVGLLWGRVFPINKPLWTSSYVVFTGGMAAMTLAVCYWLMDVRGYRKWARPFVVFGVNAIAAYFLSGLMARLLGMVRVPVATEAGPVGAEEGPAAVPLKAWIHENAFASWLTPMNASLAFALSFVLLWLGLMWILYRKRILIKV